MKPWIEYILESEHGSKPIANKIRNGIIFKETSQARTALLSVKPVYFTDEDGLTKPIDNLLRDDGSGEFGNFSNKNFRILPTGEVHYKNDLFKHKTSGFGYYQIETDTYTPALGFLSGSFSEDEFIRTSGPTSHKIRLTESGIKEELVLNSKPSNMSGDLLVFETDTLSKVFPSGELSQNYKIGSLIFKSGFAYDSSGNSIPLRTYIKDLPGPRFLVLSGIPVEWLDTATYPVIIDPSYDEQPDGTAGKDTQLRDNTPTTNYATASSVGVGNTNAGGNSTNRFLIQFDLTPVPSGGSISSGILTLTVASEQSDNIRLEQVFRMKQSWVEDEATWNEHSTGNSWGTAGAGNTGTDRDALTIAQENRTTTESGDKTQILDGQASDYAELEAMVGNGPSYTNNGFLYKKDVEVDDAQTYKTSDHGTAGDRPQLQITFIPPPGNFFPGYMM